MIPDALSTWESEGGYSPPDADGTCPHCGGRSKFGGTVVWCQCSGWIDQDKGNAR